MMSKAPGAEPGYDLADIDPSKFGFVIGFSPYRSRALEAVCDVLLPIGTFAETSGTFVNCEGRWQSFGGVANPVGEARPGWKVLRVLGNLLEVDGFDFETSEDVLDACRSAFGEAELDTAYKGSDPVVRTNDETVAVKAVPMYDIDPVVRRANALQLTPEARRSRGEVAG